ncbi:MAG: rhodanese-like domain-containing protein [Phycisphaerales bacterium]
MTTTGELVKVERLEGASPSCASPREVWNWVERGEAVLVDVREPDEHERERIGGARLLPLSRFDPEIACAWLAPGQKLALHCRGGKRSADACRLALSLTERGVAVVSMAGGIEAWKRDALPVVGSAGAPAMSVMRQVQLLIGAGVLGGSVLAWLVHPWFGAVPALLGGGMLLAGATGSCALAGWLGAMPWNRVGQGHGGRCPVGGGGTRGRAGG